MKKYLHIIVPCIAVFLCSLFLFTTLDQKVFDIFLRTIPSLKENASVVVVKIDDNSIERVGIFPWTRDIMADAIVFLREMGAESVTFDLSFLDRSPVNVDPKYVKEDLPGYLDYGFRQIDDSVSQVMDAVAQRQISPADAPEYRDQLHQVTKSARDSIDTSLAYVTRDVDTYFSRCLRLFGKSFLTLTMIHEKDIIGEDKTYNMSANDLPWLKSRIALQKISGDKDTKSPQAIGITPAIPLLMRSAQTAGFVNADPDRDGYLRRVHLVMKYDGQYFGQLVFVPLLERFGNPEVIVKNSEIILKDAKKNGTTGDIRIPRTQNGSILVKWPKKEFKDYQTLSAWSLIGYNRHEAAFVKNLKVMSEAGLFAYYEEEQTPYDLYSNAQYIREMLSEGENVQDGITFDTYCAYRRDYLEKADAFLNGPYEKAILDDNSGDAELEDYITELFAITRTQHAELLAMRETVAQTAKGAFCIIGVDATSMTDLGLTTFQERFPNVGIHATVANMLLSEEFLDDTPIAVTIIIALILSLSLGFFIKQLDTKKSMLAGAGTLAISVVVLLIFFIFTRRYIGVVVPFSSVTVTFLSLSVFTFLTTVREKSFLRSAFSRYLSPAVINEIINDPSKLNLGGEKRQMTAIFTDIRGFSGISEQMDPADLVNLLNLYLTEMSNIVLEHRGTIDKYEGDAIIAFFGAPISMEDHATQACRTAICMKKAEVTLNKKFLEENLSPTPLFTRIGINTGDMIVGNMGTPNKMDYTIMGNAVNLAARLEGVNKQYNTKGILISEHTRAQIGEEFLLRRLDRVRVVGVQTPLRLYELVGFLHDATPEEMEAIEQWEQAIDLYEQKQFDKARRIFFSLAAKDPHDKVAPLYIKRCDDFIASPPDSSWDGVFNLTQK